MFSLKALWWFVTNDRKQLLLLIKKSTQSTKHPFASVGITGSYAVSPFCSEMERVETKNKLWKKYENICREPTSNPPFAFQQLADQSRSPEHKQSHRVGQLKLQHVQIEVSGDEKGQQSSWEVQWTKTMMALCVVGSRSCAAGRVGQTLTVALCRLWKRRELV